MRTPLVLWLLMFVRLLSAQLNSKFVAYDRFGKEYELATLNTNYPFPLGLTSQVQPVPTSSCSSGYFLAYFAPGSIWDNNLAAQGVLCQVLWDISNFIGSSLSLNPATGPKIKLYCADTPTSTPNALGAASAFYVFPANYS